MEDSDDAIKDSLKWIIENTNICDFKAHIDLDKSQIKVIFFAEFERHKLENRTKVRWKEYMTSGMSSEEEKKLRKLSKVN
jgi:aromatic ring-cleaving dioxygenase